MPRGPWLLSLIPDHVATAFAAMKGLRGLDKQGIEGICRLRQNDASKMRAIQMKWRGLSALLMGIHMLGYEEANLNAVPWQDILSRRLREALPM